MRGQFSDQGRMFSYLSPEERVPKGHPLRAVRAMVRTVLEELHGDFARLYSSEGRPSIPPEQLLSALLWSGLATIIIANLVVMLGVAQVIGGEKKSGGGGFSAVLLRVVALLLAALAVEIIALGLRGYGVLPPMPVAAH